MEHYYDIDGKPCHTQPNKSKPGQTRPTTLADAKKLKLFPSVSAYLKQKAEKSLEDWKVEQVIAACYDMPCFDGPLVDYSARAKEAAFMQVGEAADLGTRIHAAIERYYTADELPEDYVMREIVLGVSNKVRDLGVAVMYAEKVLVYPELGYAGTTDIIYTRGDGFGVLDFKSKRTKPGQKVFSADAHAMQIAAYWQAFFEKEFTPNSEGINVYISTTEPGRIEVVEYDDVKLRAAWRAFQACLELYRYSTGYDARLL